MAITAAVEKVQSILPDDSTGFLVTKSENYRYLAGFTGTAATLLVTKSRQYLVTDGRYVDQAKVQDVNWDVVLQSKSAVSTVMRLAKEMGLKAIWFEADNVSYQLHQDLQALAEEASIHLVPKLGEIEFMRRRKSPDELELVRKAFRIANQAFDYIFGELHAGMTEKEIAWKLERFMREAGADKIKENHVIATGARSALPHGRATEKVVERGDFVTMDIGAVVGGYYSDLTRTVVIGEADARQREVYQWVLEAQHIALPMMGPGVICGEVDERIRGFFRERGVEQNFSHSLGHALGLEIHERPRLYVGDETLLEPGMVITVEPGLYFPGWGGVRIEDPVIITETGYENLATVTKELLIL